jgi:hypothetical protein
MQKLSGLIFAAALLFAGGAQAFQLNAHTPPTIHQLNPQPLPPGMQAQSLGGRGVQPGGVGGSKAACKGNHFCTGQHF